MASKVASGIIGRFASRLRYPQLFAVAALLFVADLFIPDLIPFVDEIMLGLLTTLLGSLKSGKSEPARAREERPPVKDVTPKS